MHRVQWILITCLLILSGVSSIQSQDLSFGFKAGLSNVSIDGPIESLSNGMELESFKANRAFILSVLLNLKFTDEFLLQTEFMYNQKGYNYAYKGPSYAILRTEDRTYTLAGHRDMSLNVSNTYFKIPVSLSYKLLNRFQFQGGVYGSLLVSSTGAGSLTYSQMAEIPGQVELTLNYNYRSNKAMGASPGTQEIRINNEPELIPNQVGAYYDYNTQDKSLFKTIDAGIHAGLNYFINQSLFVGARYSRGLVDITRNEVDRSYQSLNQGNLNFSDDQDKYSAWEFTIGFSF
ncbi:MAG TPA: outer membrane beta-barrel protein [Membranihabitans sp.]|nr:outer membrane beta-barrel protein [Membranihabitans sp.]